MDSTFKKISCREHQTKHEARTWRVSSMSLELPLISDMHTRFNSEHTQIATISWKVLCKEERGRICTSLDQKKKYNHTQTHYKTWLEKILYINKQ